MKSNGDSSRSGLLTAGGVLTIVVGAFEVIVGVILVALAVSAGIQGEAVGLPALLLPRGLVELFVDLTPIWLRVGGSIALGAVAIAGGMSALRRRSFGLSLAGAICALVLGFAGILAVIFVALRKREFGAKV